MKSATSYEPQVEDKSFAQKFSDLTLNFRRGDRKNAIHDSIEPLTVPYREPFDTIKKIREKMAAGKLKLKPDHWKPVDRQELEIDNKTAVATF